MYRKHLETGLVYSGYLRNICIILTNHCENTLKNYKTYVNAVIILEMDK